MEIPTTVAFSEAKASGWSRYEQNCFLQTGVFTSGYNATNDRAKGAAVGKQRRAIGIIRVSQVKGRDGESFASPGQQRERIEAACARDDLGLLRTVDELDVSGGTALAERTGLREAIEAVEAGEAEVIVAAYFDRLVRSLKVQAELVQRVERAGGQVLAVDVGQVTEGTASEWLSGTMHGMVAEYYRRAGGERTAAAQARAVARGVLPYPQVPPGYRRQHDGTLAVEAAEAHAVAEAFRLRAEGATVQVVRDYLHEQGIARSYHGVCAMLKSRVVLGEIHFGELSNPEAHPAIVDLETWRRTQRVSVPRGRKPKSDRLLARLGVLRCGTCGARMVVGSADSPRYGSYPVYRCPPTQDCKRRVTISAAKAEGAVVERVKQAIAGIEGRASVESNVREAERALADAQAALDGAIRSLADFTDEASVRERLVELREARDEAQGRADDLTGVRASVTIDASTDWHRLNPDERRALIRATIEVATVAPGRGPDRIAVHPFGQ